LLLTNFSNRLEAFKFMRIPFFLIVFALIVITGCKSAQPSQATQAGKYSEDLSMLRPKIEEAPDGAIAENVKRDPKVYVEPQFAVNKRLDAVLDSIDRINLTRKFIEGYTIQVYSGMKREDAMNAKKLLASSIPSLESELQYVQPNFRVKVGRYFTRLEAEKDYEQIRRYFPTAIVVPDKIAIN
jgi:hypothetical protein